MFVTLLPSAMSHLRIQTKIKLFKASAKADAGSELQAPVRTFSRGRGGPLDLDPTQKASSLASGNR
jgi:hypothetical protein